MIHFAEIPKLQLMVDTKFVTDSKYANIFIQLLFRFETSSVHLMIRKTDISKGPINDLASKLIFFNAFLTKIDQF